MPLPTKAVVNSLLARSFREGRTDMTPMKVQKMLFYLNGWHLAVTGKPCIRPPFEVWRYGPVVNTVYHELKKFGGGAVSEYVKEFDPSTETFKSYVIADEKKEFHEILDLTWEKYIGIDATRLSAMTHAPDSPWATAKREGSTIIDNETIKTYFIGLARTHKARHSQGSARS
jgi:uncharacterized phage-associated protein